MSVFKHFKRKYQGNLLGQLAFLTRLKVEDRILIAMNETTHEENLSQPLQSDSKQFKVAVNFLFGVCIVLTKIIISFSQHQSTTMILVNFAPEA